VYVHAYPSRSAGRVLEPVRDGPELIETGGDRPSPVGTIGENIHIERIVNQSYTTVCSVAVRAETIDPLALHARGIVRGVNA